MDKEAERIAETRGVRKRPFTTNRNGLETNRNTTDDWEALRPLF